MNLIILTVHHFIATTTKTMGRKTVQHGKLQGCIFCSEANTMNEGIKNNFGKYLTWIYNCFPYFLIVFGTWRLSARHYNNNFPIVICILYPLRLYSVDVEFCSTMHLMVSTGNIIFLPFHLSRELLLETEERGFCLMHLVVRSYSTQCST